MDPIRVGFVFKPSQLQLISVLTAVRPISDIDGKISHYQRILSSLPRSDPLTIATLGHLYNTRYVQSEQKEDLDRAIFHFTHAIFTSRPSWDIDGHNIVRIFFFLTSMLFQRYNHFNQPSDAQYCAEYCRYLQLQPLEAFHVPRNQVRAVLVVVLAPQVNVGIGDAVRHIDEMTGHFRELLASDASVPQSHLLWAAGALASTKFTDREVSDQVVQCLREANRRLDSHRLVYNFAAYLSNRFLLTNVIDDYEEAMALFDKIISSGPNGSYPGHYLEDAVYSSALLAWNRTRVYCSSPEYVEEVVRRCRSFLRISSTDDIRRRTITKTLAHVVEMRSRSFGGT